MITLALPAPIYDKDEWPFRPELLWRELHFPRSTDIPRILPAESGDSSNYNPQALKKTGTFDDLNNFYLRVFTAKSDVVGEVWRQFSSLDSAPDTKIGISKFSMYTGYESFRYHSLLYLTQTPREFYNAISKSIESVGSRDDQTILLEKLIRLKSLSTDQKSERDFLHEAVCLPIYNALIALGYSEHDLVP